MTRWVLVLPLALASDALAQPPPPKPPTFAEVLVATTPADWRTVDPENTLYLELASGRVIIELAPAFAPRHVANVKTLVREGYFDGLAFIRSQDNYVVQWGDPEGGDAQKQRPIRKGQRTLPEEFTRALSPDLPFTRLPDVDGYAAEVGFSAGLPAARDPKSGRAWLAHCYGMVGAGRDNAPDSGGGTELYVVIGNAPRHLDRNVTLLGRVLQGMEQLSTLTRGKAAMGFYETAAERTPIRSIRVAADVPVAERTSLEVLRTDTPTFEKLIESRRNRREEWFHAMAGHIELCNVPLPARTAPTSAH
jgi:peptidylprolyl isomerase